MNRHLTAISESERVCRVVVELLFAAGLASMHAEDLPVQGYGPDTYYTHRA